jgi:hypothetical protein
MYIDTSLNSVSTILANLYQSFYEAAVRCLEYVRVLSRVRTTCSSLLISTSSLIPKSSMHTESVQAACKHFRLEALRQPWCDSARAAQTIATKLDA